MFNFSRLSKEDLVSSDQRGFIAGPLEDEESFLDRLKKLKEFYQNPPEHCDYFLTDSDWIAPLEVTEDLFGLAPDWMVGYYSNAKLPFYQGAATWITEKEGVRFPLIQLKTQFSEKKKTLRTEILAHEVIHAARLQFDEPFFEELFAYRTSGNWLRRFFGPLFQKNWEPLLFIGLFLLLPLGEVIRYYFFNYAVSRHLWWELIFLTPWFYLGALLIRLTIVQLTIAFAVRKLRRMKYAKGKELAFLLHLTDREIFDYAFRHPKILQERQNNTLRWRQIRAVFFSS